MASPQQQRGQQKIHALLAYPSLLLHKRLNGWTALVLQTVHASTTAVNFFTLDTPKASKCERSNKTNGPLICSCIRITAPKNGRDEPIAMLSKAVAPLFVAALLEEVLKWHGEGLGLLPVVRHLSTIPMHRGYVGAGGTVKTAIPWMVPTIAQQFPRSA